MRWEGRERRGEGGGDEAKRRGGEEGRDEGRDEG